MVVEVEAGIGTLFEAEEEAKDVVTILYKIRVMEENKTGRLLVQY